MFEPPENCCLFVFFLLQSGGGGWQTFIDEDKHLHQVERSKVPLVEVEENLERSRRQLETS